MKMIRLLSAAAVLSLVSFGAAAQAVTSDNNTASTASSTVNSGASAGADNAGNAQYVQSFGSDQQHITYKAQVPLSLGGYGSFSQSNCANAVGVGATTRVFSLIMNAPKPDTNCEHAVRSNQYGQESNLALASGKPIQAEDLRSMGVWATCTSSDDDIRMCIRMGKIRYANPDKPDIHDTIPVPVYNDNLLVVTPNRANNVPQQAPLPSYPPGTLLKDGKVISSPVATPSMSADLPVKVTVSVDGASKASVTRGR